MNDNKTENEKTTVALGVVTNKNIVFIMRQPIQLWYYLAIAKEPKHIENKF